MNAASHWARRFSLVARIVHTAVRFFRLFPAVITFRLSSGQFDHLGDHVRSVIAGTVD